MAASNNRRLTVTVKPNSSHTLFRYTAKDIDGKIVRGAMEAADYDTLYTQLLAQGLYLQSATRRGASRKPAHAASAGAERPVPSAVHAAGFGCQSGARADDHLAG